MVEAIGWIVIFLGGGLVFASLAAWIAMYLARRQEIGALVFAVMAFRGALVVWVGLFIWLAPITISFGAVP